MSVSFRDVRSSSAAELLLLLSRRRRQMADGQRGAIIRVGIDGNNGTKVQ